MHRKARSPYAISEAGLWEVPVAKRLRLTWVGVIGVLVFHTGRLVAQDPSPLALLHGVEAARTRHSSVSVVLTIHNVSPDPVRKLECLVELDGDMRRFEVFEGEIPGQVTIRDGDEFRAYQRKAHADVQIYGVERALRTRGDLAFDPRVLGLSDLMSCDICVKDCLWYEDSEVLEVVGLEKIGDIDVWRVKAVRHGNTTEYWIEEPLFRVHRKKTVMDFARIEIHSEFDADDSQSPYPSRVTAVRTYTDERPKCETMFVVKAFDVDVSVPPDRFTLKSMDLPVNTPVIDYRIDRRIGYWDGEGLSERLTRGEVNPVEFTPAERGRRWLLFLLGGLPLVVLIVIYLARRRRDLPNSVDVRGH